MEKEKLTGTESAFYLSDKTKKIYLPLIAAAFLLMFFIPAFVYLFPFIFIILAIVKIFDNNKEKKQFLFKWMMTALVLRILFMVFVHFASSHYQEPPFYFFDDKSYHLHSAHLAERWHLGERPFIWMDFELGTMHTGYYRFIAGIYYIMGANYYIPLLLNAVLGSVFCILLFHLAKVLFDEKCAEKALILSAVNPVFWFWSSFFLKDTMLALFFIFCLTAYIEFRRGSSIPVFFILAISCRYLAIIRIPSLAVIVVTAFIYELLYNPRRKILFILAAIGAAAGIFSRISGEISDLQNQMIFSFLNLLPDSCATLPGTIKHIIAAIPRFFLSPYGWVTEPRFTVFYFLYPGQWFLYLFLIPHALYGAFRLIKENNKSAIWLFFPIIIKGYLYLLVFGGSAPRHVYELMGLITLLAAFGLKKDLPKWFIYIYFSSFVLFMLAQFASLVFGK